MKVKDLEELIDRLKVTVGDEFSEYTVCIECVHGEDLKQKRESDSGWTLHRGPDGWDWIEITDYGDMVDTNKKIFGISANY